MVRHKLLPVGIGGLVLCLLLSMGLGGGRLFGQSKTTQGTAQKSIPAITSLLPGNSCTPSAESEGSFSEAICEDGLDNDCDGFIDHSDEGCFYRFQQQEYRFYLCNQTLCPDFGVAITQDPPGCLLDEEKVDLLIGFIELLFGGNAYFNMVLQSYATDPFVFTVPVVPSLFVFVLDNTRFGYDGLLFDFFDTENPQALNLGLYRVLLAPIVQSDPMRLDCSLTADKVEGWLAPLSRSPAEGLIIASGWHVEDAGAGPVAICGQGEEGDFVTLDPVATPECTLSLRVIGSPYP